jgi:(2Fe-2S) ferredoxin
MTVSILICQNRTCRKQGAVKILEAFQAIALPLDVEITASGCLGQCGNGPMVLVLPAQIWYSHVTPQEIPTVVRRCNLEPKDGNPT